MSDSLDDSLEELRELYEKSEQYFHEQCEDMWNKLTADDQQAMFYSVMRRVYEFSVMQGRSYRGTLYDGFGFDPSAYMMGMQCNFFDLRNMIHDALEREAMDSVTRFEVIDEEGRTYVNYLKDDEGIKYSLQDDGRTLKVFIDGWRKAEKNK